MHVLVLYNNKTAAMPCTPKRARLMLNAGKAAIYRRVPFTIILKNRVAGDAQPISLSWDPGSKTSGAAAIVHGAQGNRVVFAANLEHRGEAIKQKLTQRSSQRHGRRHRKARYRAPRFDNRRKPEGWLPPSLVSRIQNADSWTARLKRFMPITSIDVETARFDTQLMQNTEISGVEYQQGALAGYEIREYLLEKFNRTCAYCDATNLPLEVEHVLAKSNGGSDRVSNLTLACHPCNQHKGDRDIHEFLDHDRPRLATILRTLKAPLKDAAAVNATRYAIGRAIKRFDLPVAFWSGGRTKMNRVAQGYPKDHWIDAACVGERGASVIIPASIKPLLIKAIGRGSRQMCLSNRFGFPRTAPKSIKRVHGFQTGDLVQLVQPSGKYAGVHVGIVAVRARGAFDIKTPLGKITSPAKHFTLLQRTNGYAYAT